MKVLKSLKKLSELKVSYLMPGHGNVKFGGVDFVIKQAMALKHRSSMV